MAAAEPEEKQLSTPVIYTKYRFLFFFKWGLNLLIHSLYFYNPGLSAHQICAFFFFLFNKAKYFLWAAILFSHVEQACSTAGLLAAAKLCGIKQNRNKNNSVCVWGEGRQRNDDLNVSDAGT